VKASMKQLPEGSRIYYRGRDRLFFPVEDCFFVIPRKIIQVDGKKTNILLFNISESVEDGK